MLRVVAFCRLDGQLAEFNSPLQRFTGRLLGGAEGGGEVGEGDPEGEPLGLGFAPHSAGRGVRCDPLRTRVRVSGMWSVPATPRSKTVLGSR